MNFDLKFFWGNLGVIDKLSPKYLVLAQTSGKKCPTLANSRKLSGRVSGRRVSKEAGFDKIVVFRGREVELLPTAKRFSKFRPL